jgi:protein TonB
MTDSELQRHSLYGERTLSFSLKNKTVQKVFGFVLAIHLIISLIAVFGLPDFKIAKRPDITIELGASPMASDGPTNTTKPSAQPIPKNLPKEKITPLEKDKDGQITKASPINNLAPSSSAPSGGPASAPTIDADYKAAYLQNPKPAYPPLAFKMRVEGKVVVLAEVLVDGRAGQVSLAQSSGNELLDQSALSAVKQWKFTPARKDGVIVTQAVRIPITFNLKNR